jgi:PKD repeat protein
MKAAAVRRAVLRVGGAVLVAGAASLVGMPSAAAEPCNSTSGFKPQIEWPVGETLSSPGITRAAAYDGIVDFGDGTTVPISLEEPFEHTFTEPGTYTVTSTGSGRAFTSDGGSVPCEENRFVITTVTVYPLEARMTVTRQGDASDNSPTYSFDGSASVPEGRIDQFTWDFGDGSYGSGVTAEHTYATPGRYTATLSILDDRGHPASTSKVVNAGDITAIDLGEIAGDPQLDPNVFAALGDSAGADGDNGGEGGGGGGSFPWLAVLLGGLFVFGAGLVFLRYLRKPSEPAPPAPAPSEPTGDAPPPAASDLPETVGDSGMVYAQQAAGPTESVNAKIRRGHYNLGSMARGTHIFDKTMAGEPITQQDYAMQAKATELMSRGASATSTFVGEGVILGPTDAGAKGLQHVITTVQGWFGGTKPPPSKP